MLQPDPTGESKPLPRRWRRRCYLVGIFTLLPLALAGAYFMLSLAAQRDLEAALAETDRTDPGWRLQELEAKRLAITGEQNSAINSVNARAMLPMPWPSFSKPASWTADDLAEFWQGIDSPEPPALLDAPRATALRAELKKAEKTLVELYKIADKPHGRFPIAYSKDSISTSLDHSQGVRRLVDLLGDDALLRAQDGDIEGAMKACRCMLHAGRAIGDEPTVISVLIRWAIHNVTLKRIERVLAQGELSESSLAALQHLLEEDVAEPTLLQGARGNRAMDDGCLAAMQSGAVKFSWKNLVGFTRRSNRSSQQDALLEVPFMLAPRSVLADRAALLRFNNQFVEFAKLPVEEIHAKLQELNLDTRNLPSVAWQMAIDNWDRQILRYLRSQASLRCGIVMLAAERYRRAHQHWPQGMDDLVPAYLSRAPADPFDGQPLRIRSFADGIVVYSVGDDSRDRAGNLSNAGNLRDDAQRPTSNWGFRLFDVRKRRQPPGKPSPRQ